MLRVTHFIFLFFVISYASAQTDVKNLCQQFNDYNTAVRDCKLKRKDAVPQFQDAVDCDPSANLNKLPSIQSRHRIGEVLQKSRDENFR